MPMNATGWKRDDKCNQTNKQTTYKNYFKTDQNVIQGKEKTR